MSPPRWSQPTRASASSITTMKTLSTMEAPCRNRSMEPPPLHASARTEGRGRTLLRRPIPPPLAVPRAWTAARPRRLEWKLSEAGYGSASAKSARPPRLQLHRPRHMARAKKRRGMAWSPPRRRPWIGSPSACGRSTPPRRPSAYPIIFIALSSITKDSAESEMIAIASFVVAPKPPMDITEETINELIYPQRMAPTEQTINTQDRGRGRVPVHRPPPRSAAPSPY